MGYLNGIRPPPLISGQQHVGRTVLLQGHHNSVSWSSFSSHGGTNNEVDRPWPCVMGLGRGRRRRRRPWSPIMRLISCCSTSHSSSSSSTNSNGNAPVKPSAAPLSKPANKKSHAQRRCYLQCNPTETNQYSEEEEAEEDPRGNGNASHQYPCLVLPADYNLPFHFDDDDDDAKHDTNDADEDEGRDVRHHFYYCFYSLGEKRLQRVNTSQIKGWVFPWEKDLLLPREAICVGSSHGWVAYLNPRRISCPLYLFNHPPLLSSPPSQMFRLPPLETLPDLKTVRTRKADRGYRSSSSSSLSCPVTRDYNFPLYDDPTHCSMHRDPANNRLFFSSSHGSCWKGYDKFSWCPEDMGNFMIRKLVLSSAPTNSPPPTASHVDDDDDDPSSNRRDCIALVAVARRKLHFCKLGDARWKPLEGSLAFYDDIIYSNKDQRFYALGKEKNYLHLPSGSDSEPQSFHGILESWDFRSTNNPSSSSSPIIRSILKPTISSPHSKLRGKMKKWGKSMRDTFGFEPVEYLVESPPSSGQLLRIIRRFLALPLEYSWGSMEKKPFTNYKTAGFEVYQLDPSKMLWNPVDCVGDHALFVGQVSHSFSLSTHDFPRLESNSIYFTDSTSPYLLEEDAIPELGQDTGIFHLGDKIVHEFHPKFDAKMSVWVAPN